MSKTAIRLFSIAFALNFVWEMSQAVLYQPMGETWQATRRCFVASLADALVVVFALIVVRAVFRSHALLAKPWLRYVAYAIVGFIAATLLETWGLYEGRWQYNDHMPRLFGTELGLVPLLQLTILCPMTAWLARFDLRQFRAASR